MQPRVWGGVRWVGWGEGWGGVGGERERNVCGRTGRLPAARLGPVTITQFRVWRAEEGVLWGGVGWVGVRGGHRITKGVCVAE
jgi:hypothetical protein